jgi:hypothetical protein
MPKTAAQFADVKQPSAELLLSEMILCCRPAGNSHDQSVVPPLHC